MDNDDDQMDPRSFVPDSFSQTIGNQVAASFAYARDNLLLSLQRQQQQQGGSAIDQRVLLGIVPPGGQAIRGYGAGEEQQYLQDTLPLNLRQSMSSAGQHQAVNFAMLLNYPSSGLSAAAAQQQQQHRNVTAAAAMDDRHSYSPHHFAGSSPMGHVGTPNHQRSFSPGGYVMSGGGVPGGYGQQYGYVQGDDQMGASRAFSPENLTQNGLQQQQQQQGMGRAGFSQPVSVASSAVASGAAAQARGAKGNSRKGEKRVSAAALQAAPMSAMVSTELQMVHSNMLQSAELQAAQPHGAQQGHQFNPSAPMHNSSDALRPAAMLSVEQTGQVLGSVKPLPAEAAPRSACPVCDHAFSDTEGLKQHMLTVHDVQSIAPEPPGEGLGEEEADEAADVKPPRGLSADGPHDIFSVKATEYNKFVCVDCGAEFKTKEKLIAHVRKHTDLDTLLCTLCGKSFFKTDKLARHMLVHSGERPYICRHCGATFTRSDKLRTHLQQRHGDTSHTCRICRESFEDAVALKLHLTRRACRKYRPSETEEEERRHREREALENSFNEIAAELGDPEIDLTVMLNKDRLAAKFDETLKVGGAIDTAAVVKEIVAVPEAPVLPPQGLFAEYAVGAVSEAARAKAAHARSLERIIKKINKYRTVSCPHCGLRLPGAYTMTRHLRVMHNIVKTYQYKKKGREPGEPRIRIKRPAAIKFCTCQVCGKTFSKVDTLKRHEVTHTGERNFQCRFCDAKYSRSDRLRKHLRSSHVAAAYPCIRCDAVFENKQELRTHISVHRVRSERKKYVPVDSKKRIRGPYKKRKLKLGTSADNAKSSNGGSAYAFDRVFAAPAGGGSVGEMHPAAGDTASSTASREASGADPTQPLPEGWNALASDAGLGKSELMGNVFRLSAAELASTLAQRNQGRSLHMPPGAKKVKTPKPKKSKEEDKGEREERVKRKYTKRKERRERRASVDKPRPFECKHCAERFSRFDKLQTHLSTQHDDGIYSCRQCEELFEDALALKEHEATHKEDKEDYNWTPKKTSKVAAKVTPKPKLAVKVKSKVKAKATPKVAAKVYSCRHCRKVFDSKPELQAHATKHRSTAAVSKIIDSDEEDEEEDWVPEEKVRRGGGNPLYEDAALSVCASREQAVSIVGKFKVGRKPGSYNTPRIKQELGEVSIKQERDDDDGYEQKPNAAALGGFGSSDLPLDRGRAPGGDSASDTISIASSEYKGDAVPATRSQQQVKGKKRPPHRCGVCSKTFKDVLVLRRHVERHDRQRRRREKAVAAILRGKRPYRGRTTLQRQAELQKKLAMQRSRAELFARSTGGAGEVLMPNARGLYQCSVCSLSFSMVAKLRRHVAVHSGVKPYVCRHCSRRFSRSDKLRSHLTAAHGDLSSCCFYCDATFESKSALRAHTKQHEEHRQILNDNKRFSKEALVASLPTGDGMDGLGEGGLGELSDGTLPSIKTEPSDGGEDSFSKVLGFNAIPRQKRKYTMRKRLPALRLDGDEKPEKKAVDGEGEGEGGVDGDEEVKKVLRGPLAGDKHLHCPICDKGVSSQHSLKRHVTSAHTDDRPYVCCDCPRSFSRTDKFRNHLRRHYGFIYPCTVCGETFLRWYQWRKHTLTHTLTCELCDFTCVSIASMSRHVARHTGQKQYTCAFCSKQFWRNYHLQIHTRIHTGEMPYSCDKCGRRFFRSDRLKRHMESHDRDCGLLCSTCGKSFSSNLALKVHAHIHDAPVPQKCNLCDITLPNPVEMRRHRKKVHPGEAAFMCSVCNAPFRTHAELLAHSAVHLEGGEDSLLPAGFLTLTPEGGRIKPPSKQPFLCSTCGRQLSSRHGLQRHQRIHTGERNHTCQYCAQQFTTAYGLRRHVEKHEGKGDALTTVKTEQGVASVGGEEDRPEGGSVLPPEGVDGSVAELSRPSSSFDDRTMSRDGGPSYAGLPGMPGGAQAPRYIGDLMDYAATPGGTFELLQGARLADLGVSPPPALRQPLDLAKMEPNSGLNNYR